MFDGLKRRLLEGLVLRVLRTQMEKLRAGGGAMSKLLEGNKGWIAGLAYVGVLIYAQVSGHDLTPLLEALLRATGWDVPGMREAAIIAFFGHQAFLLWSLVDGTIKRFKQLRAGATLTEVGSAEGYIKAEVAAIAEEIRKLRARDEILSAGIAARSQISTVGETSSTSTPIPSKDSTS